MDNYTKGPWSYYSGTLRREFPVSIHEIHAQDGIEIVNWSGFDGLDLPEKQIIANARLMAAAPELLSALRELLANGGPLSDPLSRKKSNERAKAAITAATSR